MSNIILGLGEYKVSKDPSDIIKIHSLGSCVAVAMINETTRTAALAHVVLPDYTLVSASRVFQPAYFANIAVPMMYQELLKISSAGKIIVKLVGGAQTGEGAQVYNIGKRNALAIKKILWELKLGVMAEDLAGDYSRTIHFEMTRLLLRITTANRPEKIL